MATIPEHFSLELIFDAGIAFMGLMSGGLKEIAPPEVPKIWVIVGTITASVAFFSAKVLFALTGIPLSRTVWFVTSMVVVWLAVLCGIIYILTRLARTITYEGETKLAGSSKEYLDSVATDPQNANKTCEELLRDAAGAVGDVWTNKALSKSRSLLGIEYAVFISLLAFGLYLGIEAYNTPKLEPTFAGRSPSCAMSTSRPTKAISAPMPRTFSKPMRRSSKTFSRISTKPPLFWKAIVMTTAATNITSFSGNR